MTFGTYVPSSTDLPLRPVDTTNPSSHWQERTRWNHIRVSSTAAPLLLRVTYEWTTTLVNAWVDVPLETCEFLEEGDRLDLRSLLHWPEFLPDRDLVCVKKYGNSIPTRMDINDLSTTFTEAP